MPHMGGARLSLAVAHLNLIKILLDQNGLGLFITYLLLFMANPCCPSTAMYVRAYTEKWLQCHLY